MTRVPHAVAVTQQDEADVVTADGPPPNTAEVDECCACGHAMYSVEFKGLWSRQTHPKQFPSAKSKSPCLTDNVFTQKSPQHKQKHEKDIENKIMAFN